MPISLMASHVLCGARRCEMPPFRPVGLAPRFPRAIGGRGACRRVALKKLFSMPGRQTLVLAERTLLGVALACFRGHSLPDVVDVVRVHEVHHGQAQFAQQPLFDGLATYPGQNDGPGDLYFRRHIWDGEWQQEYATYGKGRSQNSIQEHRSNLLQACALFVSTSELVQCRSKRYGKCYTNQGPSPLDYSDILGSMIRTFPVRFHGATLHCQ